MGWDGCFPYQQFKMYDVVIRVCCYKRQLLEGNQLARRDELSRVYRSYVPSIHPMYILYTSSINPLYTLYTPSIFPLHTLYIPSLHPIFTLYSSYIHPIFTLYTPYIHPTATSLLFHRGPSVRTGVLPSREHPRQPRLHRLQGMAGLLPYARIDAYAHYRVEWWHTHCHWYNTSYTPITRPTPL